MNKKDKMKNKTYKTIKHTWKNLPFPMEVKLHLDLVAKTYWIEVNGCQETMKQGIPNAEFEVPEFASVDVGIDKAIAKMKENN